ncbi:MAG TPA: helix-turn-helix domain-containing protein, partial [Gaiellaceae bacterium]|nr:helix-turn-helix domain-containing protein [Gaiellaceae bacterium]
MFAIGDSLREARTRRGLTAADVQKGIRIRERYLTALEEEHWDMLPGEAYTKGFLRTYAEFLGLNGNLYIDEYNARIAHRDDEPPLVPESLAAPHRTRNGVLRAVVAILVLGALVAGLAAWRLGGSTKPPARARSGAAPLVSVSASSAKPAAAQPAVTQAAAQPPAVVATRTSIAATRGRCWLSVRIGGPTGREIFRGILEQGKALHYRFTDKLWLRMGRPLLLDITVGG